MSKIDEMARESYLRQSQMIEFLLAENLALKTLLHEKDILNPEDFKRHKQKAENVLAARMKEHIEEWKKAHPEVADLFKEADQKEEAQKKLESILRS
jgi:hypothetical protein